MRKLAALWLAALGLAAAQTKPDARELNRMLDEIRAAIRSEDWTEASRLAMRLNGTLLTVRARTQSTPLLELEHLAILGGANPITRNPLLPRMVRAAFDAGDWTQAEALAREALEASRHGVFWWTGDAIHQANIVLGRLALRVSKVEPAKACLLAAGKTPGSSSLDSLGPNMGLAKELLDLGETATVLEYLRLCGQFWHGDRGKLAQWTVLVRAGLAPDFGANLSY
jgi:hypothetical protein